MFSLAKNYLILARCGRRVILNKAINQTYYRCSVYFSVVHKPSNQNLYLTPQFAQSPLKKFSTESYPDTRAGKFLLFEEFKNVLDDKSVLVIDVRNKNEVAEGKINALNHVNIPLPELSDALKMNKDNFEKVYNIPKPEESDKIVFHCLGGIRSSKALAIAENMDYENAKHYLGGYAEWCEKTKTQT